MHKSIKMAILLPLFTFCLLAQSKPETENFIIREIKTFESDDFIMKDVSFSEGGSVFNLTTAAPNSSEDRLTFSLDNVNIFMAKRVTVKGHYLYDLVVETRGRGGKVKMNGGEVSGTFPMVKGIANKTRILSLVKAFTHLKKILGTEDSRLPF